MTNEITVKESLEWLNALPELIDDGTGENMTNKNLQAIIDHFSQANHAGLVGELSELSVAPFNNNDYIIGYKLRSEIIDALSTAPEIDEPNFEFSAKTIAAVNHFKNPEIDEQDPMAELANEELPETVTTHNEGLALVKQIKGHMAYAKENPMTVSPKSKDHFLLLCIDEIVRLVGNECICDYKDQMLAERKQGRTTTINKSGLREQPAGGSDLADEIDAVNVFKLHTEDAREELNILHEKVAAQLRAPNILEALRRGDEVITANGWRFKLGEFAMLTWYPSESRWDHTNDVAASNLHKSLFVVNDPAYPLKPYTPQETALADGRYMAIHPDQTFIYRKVKVEAGKIVTVGGMMGVDLSEYIISSHPETGQPWRIDGTEGAGDE